MDFLLSRFRNLTVLLLVIFAQLILLAYQVKTNQDMTLLRVWSVTAITPLARVLEAFRSSTVGFLRDYFVLVDVREENKKLKQTVDTLKLKTQELTEQLSTADRVHALQIFQEKTPSKTIAARIIANGTGANSRVVFIDRGSASGVQRGMPVITPDGIVGKVLAAYPTASTVLLITDPSFAAGVISQKNRVRGTVKGQGHGSCTVDYIQNEEKVDPGEWFYTSGDDRIFPKGLPVGQVTVARQGRGHKEVFINPTGMQNGLEEVLVILEGVHGPIPEPQNASGGMYMQPLPPGENGMQVVQPGSHTGPETDADKLLDRYRAIGAAQGHVYGTGAPGSRPPDFNIDPAKVTPPQSKPAAPTEQGELPAPEPAAPSATPSQQPTTPKQQPATPNQQPQPAPGRTPARPNGSPAPTQ